MSNGADSIANPPGPNRDSGGLQLVLQGHSKDLGGFTVRRTLPSLHRKLVGPWIFFDHMGPATLPAGEGVSVRPHPHINLATVTYLFDGEILHRDSLGSVQAIRPGDINLMVAGRGIVHSERESDERRAIERSVHGLQLWMALPTEDEEVEPAFYHHPSATIPKVTVDGVRVSVMMGSAYGVTSPVKAYAGAVYIEADLQAGQTLSLPDAAERAVYVVEGGIEVSGKQVSQHAMAIFDGTPDVQVTALTPTRLVLVGGDPVGPRFIEWNFVSSREERIEQAKSEWKAGNYPKVPGDEVEFIPLPG